MIIDMRYHVVSLVSVFLALGLGIIIGVSIGKNVDSEFENQIVRLEETYDDIKENQKILQGDLAKKDEELMIANQFQKAILPNLITNRLLGKRIAIIRTNESVDFKEVKKTIDVLRQAGAEVCSVTTVAKPLDFTDGAIMEEFRSEFTFQSKDPRIALNEVYVKMAQLIAASNGAGQLTFMQNKEYLQMWGDYHSGPVNTIIFYGGDTLHIVDGVDYSTEKQIDQPFLDAFRKLTNIALIGVERSDAEKSYMRLYQSKCRGTVDNIDTIPGEATLVYLLASGNKGYYGTKDTARSYIPPFKLNY